MSVVAPEVSPPASQGFVCCPRCSAALAAGEWRERWCARRCPSCRAELHALALPPLFLPVSPAPVALPASEGEAACFFHAEKQALFHCDRCGRFLCSLCDFPIGSRHLCPTCVDRGVGGRNEAIFELVHRRVVWSRIAFHNGWVPLVLSIMSWPFMLITGPCAIGFALYGWRKPGSIVRGRQRWLATVAILGGILQILVVFSIAALIVYGIRKARES